jgi:hypothetical protein
MRPLARWSFARVLLLCIGWVVLCVLGPIAWVAVQLTLQMTAASAAVAGGVGAVSVGINGAVVLLPPVLFVATWLIARRRARRDQ